MKKRCTLYKHRETGEYFVNCSVTSETDTDPPMPDADAVDWWKVDNCSECTLPDVYKNPATAKKPEETTPPVEKPATGDKPADKPADKPSDKPADKPVDVSGSTTKRCTLYKHRETGEYFVNCTVFSITETDPPMPNADPVSWWKVDNCSDCKLPDPYRKKATAKKPEETKPPKDKPIDVNGPTTHTLPIEPYFPTPGGGGKPWYRGPMTCKNTTGKAWNDLHITVTGIKPKGVHVSASVYPVDSDKLGPGLDKQSHHWTPSNDQGTASADITDIDIPADMEFVVKISLDYTLDPVPANIQVKIEPTFNGKPVEPKK